MASNATITAKTGAGQQATSLVLTDIQEISFNCDGNVLDCVLRNGQHKFFAGFTTITLTLSGSSYTLTVS